MAILTSISGPSGSGKTRSFKNLEWDKTFVIRPNKKPFSFPDSAKLTKPWDKDTKTGNFMYLSDYSMIAAVINAIVEHGKKIIIIDDTTHLILKQVMDTANDKGYEKFVAIALNYYNTILQATQNLPDDVRVYIINHIEETPNGDEIIKIPGGKMITEKIDIPSMVTLALRAEHMKDGYFFRTQGTNRDFYKSPEGMFKDMLIPNDLRIVDDAICEYYGLDH
jgi:hypothetical protein